MRNTTKPQMPSPTRSKTPWRSKRMSKAQFLRAMAESGLPIYAHVALGDDFGFNMRVSRQAVREAIEDDPPHTPYRVEAWPDGLFINPMGESDRSSRQIAAHWKRQRRCA